MSGLLPHETAFRTLLRSMNKELHDPEPIFYEGHEIVPIPAICAKGHEWIDNGITGAIRAPSLRGCLCFYCGSKLRPHPGYPPVIDAETRRKMQPVQTRLEI